MPSDPDTLKPASRGVRADIRLARVVHIGTAMIPAYGPQRAARFMHARGVPPCVLVAVLRLGDRRRNDVSMRRPLFDHARPYGAQSARAPAAPVTARVPVWCCGPVCRRARQGSLPPA
ncbi:hypothetical protein ACFFTM_19065 [Pseudoduganella plicata]|uniref:Uncharacterized protein n=1 Tax=Pseudoduganella plicata TaxID=321984 RepID=A0A4P7B9E1_9BURK|nr:hypothetical protein [Pseudoduganella plicata]QBQ34944.1 hypothetical protein E1742_01175 [Pseudoduganella plicata]GGZ06176.1 hypothetical protein GCM10007388_44600 [Pseudoduganella plicata]